MQMMYLHRTMSDKMQRTTPLRSQSRALIDSCPGLGVRAAARAITQAMDRALAPTGLGIAQLGLMAQIAAAEDDTLGALARRAGVDPSTLSRNLRVLEAEGWSRSPWTAATSAAAPSG